MPTPIQENPTREIFLHLDTWMQVVFYIVSFLAIGVFLYGFWRRFKKYRRGRSENRFDQLPRRIGRAFKTILLNSSVRKRERFGGLAHSLILWGFILLFIGTCIVALDHDVLRFFDIKLLQGTFYLWFSLVLDLAGIAFIIGLVMMIWRRMVMKPRALDYKRADEHGGNYDRSSFVTDDMIFVWLLLFIAVTGYAVEGMRISQDFPEFERWSPVGWVTASMFASTSEGFRYDAHLWSWWIHAIAVLLFVAYIPFSKMMHIITDAANLVFVDERAGRRLPALPPGKPAAGEAGEPAKKPAPAMGYSGITDFTWKELLDFDACTKCGRCHVACPANAAGTSLSPRDLILDLRTFANHALDTPEWLEQKFTDGSQWPAVAAGSALDVSVADQVIRQETLWSCTTCMACMEACPVGIEHLTSIVQMRRHLVDKGSVDDNLQGALESFGEYGNSFSQSPKKRSRWTKGLSFKVKDARKEPVDYLWFVGDFASYDPRIQVLSRLVAETFQGASVDFGILHDGERNAGNDVRRIGEEGLFEMLAEENAEALDKAEFNQIVTTDPHTLNALRNEYPDIGQEHKVLHYSNLLEQLLHEGKLEVKQPLAHKVTYHDPCYLARYNGEISAPRAVMRAIGLELHDMPRCGANTFCCGAGGGRIWMDTSNEQKRTSEQRIEEALALGDIRYFVTACPKDYTMYTDAVKSLGVADKLEVKDLIELVAEAVAAPEPAASEAG
ncbi:MAG: heterodisulfide reductase-related iron-sulfur binding cluster [Planctomycetota bacterium]|nr:heterodisulfide reductase-related iron-sulfur binding cluster [Planctomycetota bacterium]